MHLISVSYDNCVGVVPGELGHTHTTVALALPFRETVCHLGSILLAQGVESDPSTHYCMYMYMYMYMQQHV